MSWEHLPGWAAFANDAYDDYIENRAKDGDVVVEVGVLFGRSLAYLARRAIDRGLRIEIHAVDPWNGDHWLPEGHPYRNLAMSLGGPYPAFCTLMADEAPEELDYVHVHRMTSVEGRKLFPDGSCAMVLIDDDHSREGCAKSIAAWRSAVKPGGLLAGDDYSGAFPGVVEAVRDAFGDDYTVRGTTWLAGEQPEFVSTMPRVVAWDPTTGGAAGMAVLASDTWVEVETVGGTHRFGRERARDGALVTLEPCFRCTGTRLLFPTPDPGKGISYSFVDLAQPYVWGDGGEEVVAFSSIKKISTDLASKYLAAANHP